jgi:hypothetical protein
VLHGAPGRQGAQRRQGPYVFYDFETTQNTVYTGVSFEHVPKLVCVQQTCAKCEGVTDMSVDCVSCGRRLQFLVASGW